MLDRIAKASVGAVALLPLLGGCAAWLDNVYAPERIVSLAPDEGRVIVSAGAPTPCFGQSTAISITPYASSWNSGPMIVVDDLAQKSDFQDHQGTVSVLNLRPGRYRVTARSLAMNSFAVQAPRYQFFLGPGENVYIGNFFMPESCGQANRVVFVDQSRRDLAMVFARNRLFTPSSVTVRIAEWDGYEVGGTPTAGPGGPVDNSRAPDAWYESQPFSAPTRSAASVPVIVAQQPSPTPLTINEPTIVSAEADPLDGDVAAMKQRTRAILLRQAEWLSEPSRGALVAQFEQILSTSTPFIRRRLNAASQAEPGTIDQNHDSDIVIPVARHAWLMACTRVDAATAAECERHRGAAEAELSRILVQSAPTLTASAS